MNRIVYFPNNKLGFSLIELMTATAISLILLVLVLQTVDSISKIGRRVKANVETFQSARTGFEALTRHLSNTTLNTYYDYFDANGIVRTPGNAFFSPAYYGRNSSLHFVCGSTPSLTGLTAIRHPGHSIFFQAPRNYSANSQIDRTQGIMNACGYLVQHGQPPVRPGFLSSLTANGPYRYRLMEFLQPSEELSVYTQSGTGWFTNQLTGNLNTLAENVILLAILPKLPADQDPTGTLISPNYAYNSRANASSFTGTPPRQPINAHQLPPIIHITMVAIDELSAGRLEAKFGTAAPTLGLETLFNNASQYDADIQTLEAILNGITSTNDIPLSYRIFEAEIRIPGAKWSGN
ncbi:MAG: Verru_Chthon cassette protein C [Verrucomicrobiota bacterium]